MRLFVAVPFSETILERCRALQGRGQTRDVAIRWCPPEQLHLTLLFLGEIKRSDQVEIERILLETATKFSPFTLRISGLGLFPKPKKPRVLWAGISQEPSLMNLQKMLVEKIGGLGIPLEKRPYRPHLTLARISGKVGRSFAPLIGWMHEEKGVEIGSAKIEEVVLMESRLKPQGTQYSTLQRAPLGNPMSLEAENNL